MSLPPNFEHEGFADQSLRHRLMRLATDAGMTPDDWRDLVSRYWGLVSLVDTHVGRVLDALDEYGLTDRTVTAYTSDHGDMMGHQRMRTKNIMSQIDLVPTFLDALGQSRPDHPQGNSLLPFLRGETDAPEEPYVVVEQNGPDGPGTDRRKDAWPASGSRPQPDDDLVERAATVATADEIRRAYLEPVRTVISPELTKLNYYRDVRKRFPGRPHGFLRSIL